MSVIYQVYRIIKSNFHKSLCAPNPLVRWGLDGEIVYPNLNWNSFKLLNITRGLRLYGHLTPVVERLAVHMFRNNLGLLRPGTERRSSESLQTELPRLWVLKTEDKKVKEKCKTRKKTEKIFVR